MYRPTITNEEIGELPVGRFAGQILVVDDEQTMRQAERILAGETVVGYDTESRPSFQKGLRHGMALVQLSTADTALLFRVKKVPLSPEICRLLSSPEVLKVGAALKEDIRGMQQVARFQPAGFVDLQSIVGQWGIEEMSVKKMAAIVLGIKVSKAQRLTNWEAVRLTDSQQHYAAMDAWVCREIYGHLRQSDPARMAKVMEQIREQDQIKPHPRKEPRKKRYRYRRKNGKTDTQTR